VAVARVGIIGLEGQIELKALRLRAVAGSYGRNWVMAV
jgi:hypothetical protein